MKYVNSCLGCPYWGGVCVLGVTSETPEDALCYDDEEHYLNRDLE